MFLASWTEILFVEVLGKFTVSELLFIVPLLLIAIIVFFMAKGLSAIKVIFEALNPLKSKVNEKGETVSPISPAHRTAIILLRVGLLFAVVGPLLWNHLGKMEFSFRDSYSLETIGQVEFLGTSFQNTELLPAKVCSSLAQQGLMERQCQQSRFEKEGDTVVLRSIFRHQQQNIRSLQGHIPTLKKRYVDISLLSPEESGASAELKKLLSPYPFLWKREMFQQPQTTFKVVTKVRAQKCQRFRCNIRFHVIVLRLPTTHKQILSKLRNKEKELLLFGLVHKLRSKSKFFKMKKTQLRNLVALLNRIEPSKDLTEFRWGMMAAAKMLRGESLPNKTWYRLKSYVKSFLP